MAHLVYPQTQTLPPKKNPREKEHRGQEKKEKEKREEKKKNKKQIFKMRESTWDYFLCVSSYTLTHIHFVYTHTKKKFGERERRKKEEKKRREEKRRESKKDKERERELGELNQN